MNNRKRFQKFTKKYPGTVVIEKASINYSLRKKGGEISSSATLVQYPIKVAHAITAHKVQGQTIPKPLTVAFDLIHIFEEAQGYVMLSRVQELSQIFIIENFDSSKLYPSQKALKELERMNMVSINRNPGSWHKPDANALKIAFMNCAGLKPHYEDLKNDAKLRKADIILLAEISLMEEEHIDSFPLLGYTQSLMTMGNGKGLGGYYDDKKFRCKIAE